jgi:DNA-binding winged helix-turn-helix (wHTH) protein
VIYSFLDYELDEGRFELRRAGVPVPIQPKALRLLAYLVRNRTRAVTAAELIEVLWPDTKVTGNSVARALKVARLALDDRRRAPRLIATVPRRGYRFAGAVRESASPEEAAREDPAAAYVGRTALLERLDHRLEAALAGAGSVLFLTGEAGIGKTRTAERLAERARRAGARVATAVGGDDASQSYGSWCRVVRALAATALADLAGPQRAALAPLLPPQAGAGRPAAAPGGEEAERWALFDAVQALLTSSARSSPVFLLFDDLHDASADSIALLEHVGRDVATLPIAIAVTCREEAASAPRKARALERLLRLTALERWPLDGLDAAEAREFVEGRLGRAAAPELLAALAQKTGGNPLWMAESLRSLEARNLLGVARRQVEWEALLPRGIRHLLVPKLGRLSAGARELLGFAAALGSEVDHALLERCVPATVSCEGSLAESFDAGLLLPASALGQGARFAHALVREALYDELVPAGRTRRAVHARIESELGREAEDDEASVFERAHHACEAVPDVPVLHAVDLARRAGARAARDRDYERAAAWYERGLERLALLEGGDLGLRASLQLGLGAAQTRAFGLERARASYREAADAARTLGHADLFAEAVLGFAHRPDSSGSAHGEALVLLEEANRSGPGADATLAIRVRSRLAVELRYVEPARARELSDEVTESARRSGDGPALAQALDDSSFVHWSLADTRAWIALNAEVVRAAEACGDHELLLSGLRGVATGYLELGDLAGVRRQTSALARTAALLRTPQAHWLHAAHCAMTALLAGDLVDAEQRVTQALALGDRLDSREVGVELGIQLLYLRLEQGRAHEVEPAARREVERFPDTQGWRAGLATLQAAAGMAEQAAVTLAPFVESRFTDVRRDRGFLPTLAMAVDAVFAAGDAAAAAAIEPLLAPYAALHVVAGSGVLHYGSVARVLGRLAAMRAAWDEAEARLTTAIEAEERAGARLWATRSRIDLARVLFARDTGADRKRGGALVRTAAREAERSGWTAVASAARDVAKSIWAPRTLGARSVRRRPASAS